MAESSIRAMVLALERNGQALAIDARQIAIVQPRFSNLFAFARSVEEFFLFVEVIDERVELTAEEKRPELRGRLAMLRNLVAAVALTAINDTLKVLWPSTAPPLGMDGRVREVAGLVHKLRDHRGADIPTLDDAAIDAMIHLLFEIAEKTPGLEEFDPTPPRPMRAKPGRGLVEPGLDRMADPTMQPLMHRPAGRPTGANGFKIAAEGGYVPTRLQTAKRGNLTYLKRNYTKVFEAAARHAGIQGNSFADAFRMSPEKLYFVLVGSDPVPPSVLTNLRQLIEGGERPTALKT